MFILVNRRERIQRDLSLTSEASDIYGEKYKTIDFSKIRVGVKNLDDAVVNLGDLKKINPRLADKNTVLNAINNADIETMRDISNFFYKTSGIYSRLCRYMAYLYRYDWFVTPFIPDMKKVKPEDVLTPFNNVLTYLENFGVKKFFGEVALKVLKNGCYYGYLVDIDPMHVTVQELPVKYCRSRYSVNGKPAIEFNMSFFDTVYTDNEQRQRILKLFPEDFQKGYRLYKTGKLVADFQGDSSGWYLLDPEKGFKFNLNGEDYPFFISTIPYLIDLDAAQELDRKKMAQKLLKILIQKLPLDKNGDLIFDVDEGKELHKNAVQMLSKAIGIDILTTFADVSVEDMSDTSSVSSIDELEKVERTVYNESGTAQNLFNTDGNLALEKSILNDEATIYNLIQQFEAFLNGLLKPFNNKPKKMSFQVQILSTTIYNYKDLAKMYKEQTQLGYSKMLPQIALGQTQRTILANAYFENDILDLVHVFIPPLMSSTMNAEGITSIADAKDRIHNEQNGDNQAGRKEKPDDEKSEKTIANKEAMS